MDEIIKMISELIEGGKAYAIPGGDVNYSVRSFEEYGKLSNRKPDELIASGRIERDPAKRDPLDFALWKKSKENEPSWESPWGAGRPGWHIECSAMAKKHLGEQIDIHGGGLDLVFPHHENEIAQTEGCTHKQFAKYWVHNNMIEFGGAKMSKSLGNIVTGRGFMSQYNAEILKYMMLSVHYRSISDFSEDGIQQAIRGLARIYSAMCVAEKYKEGPFTDPAFRKVTDLAWEGITTALNDDFNTPEAFARVFEVVRQFNSQVKLGNKKSEALAGKANAFLGLIKKFGSLTALFQQEPGGFLKTLDDLLLKKMDISRESIDSKVKLRTDAREAKDFKKSDEIRAELAAMGISVMDTPEGTLWEVTK
jgi:cysteinyl-tRNA synthetase